MKSLAVSLLLVLMLGIFVASAAAQEGGPTPHPDEVNAIARNLYCPVCANVPLDVCGTAACAQWRQQIADLLTQGYTEQQIYDYFVQQYGPSVLATPPASGFNWLIYLLPPAVVLLGALFLSRGLLNWKCKPAKRQLAHKKSAKDKYAQHLEDELRARR
ncbi:MAG: cytochrome c-type biogenesis protein CcmH [Chloroflexi bacterium]|nr:cytochrome c-type biogenesis protein CcmH [Chloroflexota bacterium]